MTARRDIEVKLNPGWLRRELRAASIFMEEYREAEKRAEQRTAKEEDKSRSSLSQSPPEMEGSSLVERICRAICGVEGIDPDELQQEYETEAHAYRPTDLRWTRYADAVAQALGAADKAEGGGT